MHTINIPKLPLICSVLLFVVFFGCKEKKEVVAQNTAENPNNLDTVELLIGTYTQNDSKGIYKATFNEATGTLENPLLIAETENPSFLCQSADKKTVYSTNEVKDGSISTFTWNADRSALTQLSKKPTEGSAPCHITLNGAQNLVASANYSSGTLTLYRTNAQGNLIDEPQVRHHEGSGPVLPAQKSAHTHYAAFAPNDKYLYAVDLGIDKVLSYPISADGDLGEKQIALQMDPGDGPRHMVYHPTKDIVFIINEHSNSIVSASVDHNTGAYTRIDKKSTLPTDYSETSYCADIHISKDGKFLYGSNRGHNSIAVFSVSDEGMIALIDTVPVEGDWPRNFTLSPNGNYMLVANQKSDNITVFKIDKNTGLPTYTGQELKLSIPVCLSF